MARRTDIDWERIELDVRAGKMSKREIAKRHGISYSQLRIKCEERGWTPDLTDAVRVATKAALIEESRVRAVKRSQDEVKARAESIGTSIGELVGSEPIQIAEGGIAAAVTENLLVIGSHREMLNRLKRRLADADAKVSALGEAVADIREAKVFADAVASLANVTKATIEMERKTYNLDEDAQSNSIDDLLIKLGRGEV